MLYYYRISVSEGIGIKKVSALKECDIWHYWYFLNKEIKFKPYVCHDLLMNLSDIAILHIKGSDYCCIISGISKREAIKLFENTDLT